jgi:hypothetical protein
MTFTVVRVGRKLPFKDSLDSIASTSVGVSWSNEICDFLG